LDVLGGFSWVLGFSLVLVTALGLWSASSLFRPGASADSRTRIWIDATLFWGQFAFIVGAIGAVVGLIRTFQGYEAAGRFASAPVAEGLVMLCLSALLGLSILAVAGLFWFILQLRWRLLETAARDGSSPTV
jgi:hypothetical protein